MRYRQTACHSRLAGVRHCGAEFGKPVEVGVKAVFCAQRHSNSISSTIWLAFRGAQQMRGGTFGRRSRVVQFMGEVCGKFVEGRQFTNLLFRSRVFPIAVQQHAHNSLRHRRYRREEFLGNGCHGTLKAAGRAAIPRTSNFSRRPKRRKFKNARLAAFGSTRKKNTPVEQDDQVRLLIEAGTPVVTIYGKTSMLHVKEVLRCTPEENLAMIGDTVKFLKDHGKFVIYDAEHCFRRLQARSRIRARHLAGGGKSGRGFRRACATRTAAVCRRKSPRSRNLRLGKLNCKIGIHTHDDIGLGVANALAALEAGAVHVQGTINGYGERTGNCNLTSVIPCVALKLKKTCVPAKSLPKLKELSQFVDEIANMRHNPRLPWVGSAAFAHKGGTHVNAVQKLASSYEHIDPSLVGNERNVLISDLAGRSNIVMKAQELGLQAHERHAGVADRFSTRIKEL